MYEFVIFVDEHRPTSITIKFHHVFILVKKNIKLMFDVKDISEDSYVKFAMSARWGLTDEKAFRDHFREKISGGKQEVSAKMAIKNCKKSMIGNTRDWIYPVVDV